METFQELYQQLKEMKPEEYWSSKGWKIIGTLDEKFGFGLDNHSLGISIDKQDIVIHYHSDRDARGIGGSEVNIKVHSDDLATKISKYWKTGEEITTEFKPAKSAKEVNKMNKIELIKATFQAVETLCERVHNAGITSSMTEGTYHHEIAYGLAIPLTAAKSYFERVINMVENPEIGKRYSIFRPFQMVKVIRVTKAAKAAIDSLPFEQVQEVHNAVQTALNGDLEGSVAHYANALSHKRGQKIIGEDVVKMQPVMKAMEAMIAYSKLQERYKPAF